MVTLEKNIKRKVPAWYEEWVNTLNLDTNQELVVRGSFTYDDMTLEEVKLFADKKYPYEHMTEIRNAIKCNFTDCQLAMIQDVSLSLDQVREIVKLCKLFNYGPQTELRRSNFMSKVALLKLSQ